MRLRENTDIPDISRAIYSKINYTIPYIQIEKIYKLRQGQKWNWILNITKEIDNYLIQHKMKKIHLHDCPVRHLVNVKQCFHYQKFDHIAKFCANDLVCANYGGSHTSLNCKNIPRCINCIDCNWSHKSCFSYLFNKM